MANIECSGKTSTKILEIFDDTKTTKWIVKIESDGSLVFSIA